MSHHRKSNSVTGRLVLTGVVWSALLPSTLALAAEGGAARQCNNASLRGAYGVQMQGTVPIPQGNGAIQSVIGVVVRQYDGVGNFDQVDNINGSVTGLVPDRPGYGTYEVRPDCTVITRIQPDPGNPNLVIEERIVIVDDGNELLSVTTAPPGFRVTTVSQRIHSPRP
jgi:hypothetical protein